MVLPLDSGPKISTTRPQGMPWPPKAMSSDRLPVGMPLIGAAVLDAQRHDGPFAELLFDLGDGVFQVGMGVENRGDFLARPFSAAAAFLAMIGFREELRGERVKAYRFPPSNTVH